MRFSSATVFATLASIMVLVGIVAGFIVIGSPSEIRLRRFDEIRIGDLSQISLAIVSYRNTHDSLPQTLDDLKSSVSAFARIRTKDPMGRPYEYAVKDAISYDLCAEFDRPAEEPTEAPGYLSKITKHGQGKECFTLEARPPIRR